MKVIAETEEVLFWDPEDDGLRVVFVKIKGQVQDEFLPTFVFTAGIRAHRKLWVWCDMEPRTHGRFVGTPCEILCPDRPAMS